MYQHSATVFTHFERVVYLAQPKKTHGFLIHFRRRKQPAPHALSSGNSSPESQNGGASKAVGVKLT